MTPAAHSSGGPLPGGGLGADVPASLGLVPIERLLAELVERANDVLDAQLRLRRLLAANRAIMGELKLSVVLRRIIEAAQDLVRARYGALGVIGADGRLEQFIHVGMDEATVTAIGELPKGRGLLGALVDDPRPIRRSDIAEDPRSVGWPVEHPATGVRSGCRPRPRSPRCCSRRGRQPAPWSRFS